MWKPTFVLWQLPFFHTYQTRFSKGLWGWIRMVSMKLPTTEVLAEVLENLAAGFPWWDYGSLSQKEIRDKMTCRFSLGFTDTEEPATYLNSKFYSILMFQQGSEIQNLLFFLPKKGARDHLSFSFHSFIYSQSLPLCIFSFTPICMWHLINMSL